LEFKKLEFINFTPKKRPMLEKYVVIAPESTAGCKEWVYENWVKVSEYLKEKGYEVVILTLKPYYIQGTTNVSGKGWNEVFNYLYHSEFLIGLSSGLAWCNWALNKKTVMISGFSEAFNEFNKNNIMSIQTILDKRRSTPFLNIINTIPNQSRSVLNDKIDIDFNPIFNLKNDINDIADLNVNNLPKMKRGIPRNKYAIQRSKSKGSKGSKSKKTKSKGSKSKKNKSKGSKGNGKKASKK
jgi:hypothetical protein